MKIITKIRTEFIYSKKIKELNNCFNKIKKETEVLSNWENLRTQILNFQKIDIEILTDYLSPQIVSESKFFATKHISELYSKLTKVREMKVKVVKDQNFERSADLRDAEKKLYSELIEEYVKFKNNKVLNFRMIQLKQILYIKTGINEIDNKIDKLIYFVIIKELP